MNRRFEQGNEDNVYYNMALHNINDFPVPAYIYEQRSSTVIRDTTGYKCSIVRFTFPSSSIPLLIAPQLLVLGGNTSYSITLNFGALSYQTFVPYTSHVANNTNLYPDLFVYYTYQQFCDDMNIAFVTSFNTLKLNNPACVSVLPPKIYYNTTTETFNIYLDSTYQDGTVNGINIHFNSLLSNLLQTFVYDYVNYNGANGNDSRLQITPSTLTSISNVVPRLNVPFEIANEPTFLLLLDQQCSSIQNFNSVASIFLRSDLLPAINEYSPSIQSFSQNLNVASNSSPNVSDFEPNFTIARDMRSIYTYLPTAEYRRISLQPAVKIDKLDMRFLFTDTNGNTRSLYLLPNQTCTIKILFTRN